MPFKSLKQRAKFLQLVSEGKMSQETFDKWEKETVEKKLPVRVKQVPKTLVAVVKRPRRVLK